VGVVSDTKAAVAALMFLTTDKHWGPPWLQAILGLLRLVAIAYLAWFVFLGPEPVEVRKRRKP
jgi:hypothetical protein